MNAAEKLRAVSRSVAQGKQGACDRESVIAHGLVRRPPGSVDICRELAIEAVKADRVAKKDL